MYDGGIVIVFFNILVYVKIFVNNIKKEFLCYFNDDICFCLFIDFVCSFIGNKGSKFRGLKFLWILYIIDEFVKFFDMDKIYSVYIDIVYYCCNSKCCIGGIICL